MYDVTYLENTRNYQTYKLRYEDHYSFSECRHSHSYGESMARVNSKGIYVIHIKGDNLVRFSAVNFIYSQGKKNCIPCQW